MKCEYVGKEWIRGEGKRAIEIMQSLEMQIVGKLRNDDYITQRCGEEDSVFYLFHVSWGDSGRVRKYKLYRFSWGGENERS